MNKKILKMVYDIKPIEDFEKLSKDYLEKIGPVEWNEVFQAAVAIRYTNILPFIMLNGDICLDYNAAIEVAVEENISECYEYLLEFIDTETEADRKRNAKTLIAVLNAGWDDDLDFWIFNSDLDAVLELLKNNDVIDSEMLDNFRDYIIMCQSEEQKDVLLHNVSAVHSPSKSKKM